MLGASGWLWAASGTLAEEQTVRQIMEAVTVPESNSIFEVMDAPKTDPEWQRLRDAATKLMATRDQLLDPSRARDAKAWVAQVNTYGDAAAGVKKAVEARNFDGLLEASDSLAATCLECHKLYLGK